MNLQDPNGDRNKKGVDKDITLPTPPPPPPDIESVISGGTGGKDKAWTAIPEAPAIPVATPQGAGSEYYRALEQENQALKGQLDQLGREILEYQAAFAEIRNQLAEVDKVLAAKDEEIQGKDLALEGKQSEIDQMRSTMDLLRGEMKNKDSALLRSRAKVEVLEESIDKVKQEYIVLKKDIKDKASEIETLTGDLQSTREKNEKLEGELRRLEREREEEREQLQQEKFAINDRLSKRMQEVEELQEKIAEQDRFIVMLNQEKASLETLIHQQDQQGQVPTSGTTLLHGKEEIITCINELLDDARHSVMLIVPTMDDLKEIDLSKLRPSVKVSIMAWIDMANQEHLDLYEALTDTGNIEIRSFDWKDRFGINVDRGKAIVGVNSSKDIFGMLTDDEDCIDFFVKRIIVECWTLARKMR